MTREPGTRNAERTRQAILEATVRLVHTRGTGISIADIGAEAAVSKGGVLHHFANRDALFLAAAAYVLEQWRAAVIAHLDLSENHPGKLLRAYVRTTFDEDAVHAILGYFGDRNALQAVPGVAELVQEDERQWSTDLAQDGMHSDRVLLVRHAAEGLAVAAAGAPEQTAETRDRARRVLLALTQENGPLVADDD